MCYVLVHARAVEHGGDTMLPRIGMMRALYPDETVPTLRKKRPKRFGSSADAAGVRSVA
jgi:hypothetical protein